MIKKIFIYSVILLFTFIILEITTRAFFNELSNNSIHKTIDKNRKISKSIYTFTENFDGFVIRKANKIYDKKINFDRVYLIGDSVTGGYGLKYTDTYFSMAEDMINASSLNKKRFLSISGYNNSIFDSYNYLSDNMDKFSKDDYLMFQFNFNDLNFSNFEKVFSLGQSKNVVLDKSKAFNENNLNSEDKELISNNFDNYNESLSNNIIYKLLTTIRNKSRKLRANYLNHSGFLRVMQHYAGIFSRNTSGSCEDRKFDALGQYTYTFGSIGFEKESEILWKFFENFLYEMSNYAKKNDIHFVILISPISLLVDHHDHLNHIGLSLDCATIDAHKRLTTILEKNNIAYIDPLDKFNSFTQINLNEKNQVDLFHNYDTNHPNYNGSYIIALSIFEYFNIK